VLDFGGCSIQSFWGASDSFNNFIWLSVPCCNDGSVGELCVTTWTLLGTTHSILESTSSSLVKIGTSNALEDPTPSVFYFSTYFWVDVSGQKQVFTTINLFHNLRWMHPTVSCNIMANHSTMWTIFGEPFINNF